MNDDRTPAERDHFLYKVVGPRGAKRIAKGPIEGEGEVREIDRRGAFSRERPAIPHTRNMELANPPTQSGQSSHDLQTAQTTLPPEPQGRRDSNSYRNTAAGQDIPPNQTQGGWDNQPYRNTRSSQRGYVQRHQFHQHSDQQTYGKRGRTQGDRSGDSPPNKDSCNGSDRYRSRF